MPGYRLDKSGTKLVLDPRTIGEDGYFPDRYPNKLPSGDEHPNAGEVHPKAGQIDWAYLKSLGFEKEKLIVPYDERQNLSLSASAANVRISRADEAGVRAEVMKSPEVAAMIAEAVNRLLEEKLAALGIKATVAPAKAGKALGRRGRPRGPSSAKGAKAPEAAAAGV